jgi:two-component system, cell cycle response regulator DivK
MARILVVEDNEMNRDMLARRLQRRGYDVLTAADGQQGVAATLEQLPDLVLMDLSLPLLDGWQATRSIKRDQRTRHIPVIALTAHAMVTDRDAAMEAGCDDFDTKPLEFERLLEKITRLMNGTATT